MVHALLYVPDRAGRRLATRAVAGRSLIVRGMVAALRAGAAVIAVPAALRDAAVDSALRQMPALAAAVCWLTPGSPEPPGPPGTPWLLVPASSLVPAPALEGLLAGAWPLSGAVVAGSAEAGAPVALGPHPVVASLWGTLAAGEPVGEELARRLREAGAVPRETGGPCAAVHDEAGLAQAEEALMNTLGIAADSTMDRYLHRRCSRWITRLLVRTPVTPNQLSISSLAIGGIAIWCFWHATAVSAVWGVIFYALASIMDHSDGEVARLTFQESRFGANLDWTIDTIIHAGLVLGMAVTAGGPLMLAAGVLGAGGVAMSALSAWYLPREIMVGETVGGVLKNIANRDLFYMLLVSFVLLRWLLPPVLIGQAFVVAVGSQVYWIGCLTRIRRMRAEPSA